MTSATTMEMAHVGEQVETPVAPSAPRPTQLGVMLALWREVNCVSLRQVEQLCGIDHCTLHRLETGGQCDVASWLKLQKWLFGPAYQGAQ